MKRVFGLLFLAANVFYSSSALACAACFGASDSPMAHGMNWGIAVLLGVISTMLALVASFFVFVIRRERSFASPEIAGATPTAPDRSA